jgi:UDPglucose 6-dehydrogenase
VKWGIKMLKLAFIGVGYVGLVTGTCMAELGMEVTCVDISKDKIDKLNSGIIPIYELGLEEMVLKNIRSNRLKFTTDMKRVVENSDVIFVTVGTPQGNDGSADLSYVEQAVKELAKYMNKYKVIVDKSTVPIGTGKLVKRKIEDELKARGVEYDFDVVSNPEFLREGSAIDDFMNPDRIIVGAENKRATNIMKLIYKKILFKGVPLLLTDLETAELIKYSANAFLASKISYINELTELCELMGADIKTVSKGIGMDKRIGSAFLNAGPGYGGSCFPKDTAALIKIADTAGCKLSIIDAVVKANDKQKERMFKKINTVLSEVNNKVIAILGVTFKAGTDDVRESPAISLINNLLRNGANLRIYDPEITDTAFISNENLKSNMCLCSSEYEAVEGAEALVIATEWSQFKKLDLEVVKSKMESTWFFDLRNMYNPVAVAKAGFKYIGNGRNNIVSIVYTITEDGKEGYEVI